MLTEIDRWRTSFRSTCIFLFSFSVPSKNTVTSMLAVLNAMTSNCTNSKHRLNWPPQAQSAVIYNFLIRFWLKFNLKFQLTWEISTVESVHAALDVKRDTHTTGIASIAYKDGKFEIIDFIDSHSVSTHLAEWIVVQFWPSRHPAFLPRSYRWAPASHSCWSSLGWYVLIDSDEIRNRREKLSRWIFFFFFCFFLTRFFRGDAMLLNDGIWRLVTRRHAEDSEGFDQNNARNCLWREWQCESHELK